MEEYLLLQDFILTGTIKMKITTKLLDGHIQSRIEVFMKHRCISASGDLLDRHECELDKDHSGPHRCFCGEEWENTPHEHLWEIYKQRELRHGVMIKKKCVGCGKKTKEYYWKIKTYEVP